MRFIVQSSVDAQLFDKTSIYRAEWMTIDQNCYASSFDQHELSQIAKGTQRGQVRTVFDADAEFLWDLLCTKTARTELSVGRTNHVDLRTGTDCTIRKLTTKGRGFEQDRIAGNVLHDPFYNLAATTPCAKRALPQKVQVRTKAKQQSAAIPCSASHPQSPSKSLGF